MKKHQDEDKMVVYVDGKSSFATQKDIEALLHKYRHFDYVDGCFHFRSDK